MSVGSKGEHPIRPLLLALALISGLGAMAIAAIGVLAGGIVIAVQAVSASPSP